MLKRLFCVVTVLSLLTNSSALAMSVVLDEDQRVLLAGVIISEVQTAGTTAKDEFIEIYNLSPESIDMAGYRLQYLSATGSTWTTKLTLDLELDGYGTVYFVASSFPTELAGAEFNAGLSATGGHLRLLGIDDNELDRVGWGTALYSEGDPAAAPEASQSMERFIDTDNIFIDTNNNLLDFEIMDIPSPGNVIDTEITTGSEDSQDLPPDDTSTDEVEPEGEPNMPPDDSDQPQDTDTPLIVSEETEDPGTEDEAPNESDEQPDVPDSQPEDEAVEDVDVLPEPDEPSIVEAEDQQPADDEAVADDLDEQGDLPEPENDAGQGLLNDSYYQAYLPLLITELLPNPAAPQLDSTHEFVELFNPNNSVVALSGIKVSTGLTFRYSHTFSAEAKISPFSYIALYSADTSLKLANAAGAAKLSLPSGANWGDSVQYSAAPAGRSWALFEAGYDWTSIPTPTASNMFTQNQPSSNSDTASTTSDATIQKEVQEEVVYVEKIVTVKEEAGVDYSVYKPLLITELLPNPAAPQLDSTHEFVELFNPNLAAVPLGGLRLLTGKNLSKSTGFKDTYILPGEFIILTSADTNISLANSGGQVQLAANNEPWAEASYGAAKAGLAYALFEGQYKWTTTPTPADLNLYTAVTVVTKKTSRKVAKKKTTKVKSASVVSTVYLKNVKALVINELFPNPASPQIDAQHEFIELFNDSNQEINYGGLIIQTGAEFSKKVVIESGSLGPGEYLVIYSGDTSLSLTNKGGAVRLVLSDGTVWGEPVVYGKAKSGQSYALSGGAWGWTSSVTPGEVNQVSLASKASATTSTAKAGSYSSNYQPPDELANSKPSWILVGGIAGLTVLYGTYEYRRELVRAGRNIRGYQKFGRKTGR